MNRVLSQLIRFGVVGVLATAIDFLALHILTDYMSIHYLIATPIAFIISIVFNYWASMKYIFVSRYSKEEKHKEFIVFLALSIAGLLLTEALMFVAVGKVGFSVMVGKVLVTAVVMVFNFVTRKIFLDS